jgi:hypothetical protein
LWSPTLAFNLFGDLAADLQLADKAVHAWWADTPGTVAEVRFAHSPGRFDPTYLGSLRDFDVAFVLDVGDGTRRVVALDTKYTSRPRARHGNPAGSRGSCRSPSGRAPSSRRRSRQSTGRSFS